jgi:hypothetical protein
VPPRKHARQTTSIDVTDATASDNFQIHRRRVASDTDLDSVRILLVSQSCRRITVIKPIHTIRSHAGFQFGARLTGTGVLLSPACGSSGEGLGLKPDDGEILTYVLRNASVEDCRSIVGGHWGRGYPTGTWGVKPLTNIC